MATEAVKQLISYKTEIESEIHVLQNVLRSHGTNMVDDLVDDTGYPKSDIDIITVRKTRVRIIYLQNDLKNLMKEIEEGLHKVHEETRLKKTEEKGETTRDEVINTEEFLPFLIVDTVTEGSPAQKAGLQVNDVITRFGSVTLENFTGLQTIGSVVQHSKGLELNIEVKRNEEIKQLKLTPNTWSGKGLLGCNVVPLKR